MENPFEEIVLLLREVKQEQQEIKAALAKLEHKENGDELVTRFEKAKALNVSLATLRNWEVQGIITPVRKGRKVFFHKSDKHPKQMAQ